MADARPIGVFDSGVGGLTVLHECLVTMPHEDFVYLGDHARLPYGPRSRDEVRRFAHEIGVYLERQGVKMVVVACNTELTVARGRYESLVRTLDAGARFTGVACPKLVPLIEAGDTYSDELVAAVR